MARRLDCVGVKQSTIVASETSDRLFDYSSLQRESVSGTARRVKVSCEKGTTARQRLPQRTPGREEQLRNPRNEKTRALCG